MRIHLELEVVLLSAILLQFGIDLRHQEIPLFSRVYQTQGNFVILYNMSTREGDSERKVYRVTGDR